MTPQTEQLALKLDGAIYGAENIAPLFGRYDARWLRRNYRGLPVTKLPGGKFVALLEDIKKFIHDKAMENMRQQSKEDETG